MKSLMDSGSSNETAMVSGVLVGLLTGALMGGITGGLIAIGKLPPFIASLGMMGVGGSLSLVLAESTAIYVNNPVFSFFGETLDKSIHSPLMQYLSVPTFIAVAVFVVIWVVLYHTPFGRYIIAIGGNEQGHAFLASTLHFGSGWSMSRPVFFRRSAASPWRLASKPPTRSWVSAGSLMIAAAILGGTSFAKGKGGIAGTVLGALVIGVARNGLNVTGAPPCGNPR